MDNAVNLSDYSEISGVSEDKWNDPVETVLQAEVNVEAPETFPVINLE